MAAARMSGLPWMMPTTRRAIGDCGKLPSQAANSSRATAANCSFSFNFILQLHLELMVCMTYHIPGGYWNARGRW